ncbi:MAG: BamA/TamA family outer membrane protein [Negativicutes bacterium]
MFSSKKYLTMLALLLILTMLLPTVALATQYDGKMVTDVGIVGTTSDISQPLMPLLRLQTGMLLSGDIVDKDVEMLTQCGYFYRVSPRYVENPGGVSVIYDVMPNVIVKSIVFKGDTIYKPEQLIPLLDTPVGQILNNRALQQGIQAVLKKYAEDGYVLAKASDVDVAMDGTITITLTEGIVESIVVSGNDKTSEYVITRELRIKAGKPFNKNDYVRSYQRLNNLGFFSDVSFTFPPGRLPNQIDVDIKVKEGRTGQFNIGGGYATGSNNGGFFGTLGVGDTNLFGTGDAINLQYALGGGGMNNKSITFTRPYLTESGTSLSVSIYDNWSSNTDYGLVNPNTPPVGGWSPSPPAPSPQAYPWSNTNLYSQARSSYNTREIGSYVTLGQQFGEYERWYATLKTRNFSYEGNPYGPIDYQQPTITVGTGAGSYNLPNPYYGFINKNFGTLNSVMLSRVYDSRDNVFAATSGQYQSVSLESTGLILGGNFTYQKLNGEYRTYMKTLWDQTIAFKASGGVGFGDVPEVGGYYLGGPDNLRGYNSGQFTGSAMVYGTLEYRIPVIEKIQAVLFTDVGQTWAQSRTYNPAYGPVAGIDSGDWRADYGIGFRVVTPIGPLRFDWGLPYSSADADAFGGVHFYFSMGASF